jgi:hypothetical protein
VRGWIGCHPGMSRCTHLRLTTGIVLGAMAIATPFLAGASQASTTPGANTPVAVQPGISAATLPGATPFGDLVEPTAWSFNPAPSVTSGSGRGRAVPDLSADADPYSGYLLYEPSLAGVGAPVLQGGWGGTSFVAPQFNGSTAVIDSLLGHRIGFWNPAVYADAISHHSPFTPISQAGTGSDNLSYTGNPGEPYNAGSGLGYPSFGKLAADYSGRR